MVPDGPAVATAVGGNLPRAMHLRPPSLSNGFTSFLWALGLGLFVWIGLVAVDVSGGTAFLLGLVAAFAIFFFVLLYGGAQYRR